MKKSIFALMATIATTAAMAQQIQYPRAAKDGTVDEYFGTRVADPYRWLENDTSAQTAAWVEAENKVTNAYFKAIPFRQKLLKRLQQVVNYDTSTSPYKRHGKWYVSRHTGLQNQSVIYQMDELGGEERVFLDPNALSTDGTVALKGLSFSNNGKWAAYSISRSGSDWEEFYVIDLKTG
ncbi:MAG: S9 family peptidase, partial [Prevotella sp.]|nr:S9 family peptidase [Prevotella sp.]